MVYIMNFNNVLRKKALKATPQRLLILDIINKRGHVEIEELYKNINKIIPSISVATIYKNLKLLTEKKIVKEVNINSFKTLYEVNTSPHIHFICKNCNKIFDIEIQKKEIKSYFKKIINTEIDEVEVTLYSKCNSCKKKS